MGELVAAPERAAILPSRPSAVKESSVWSTFVASLASTVPKSRCSVPSCARRGVRWVCFQSLSVHVAACYNLRPKAPLLVAIAESASQTPNSKPA
jgi:hypothetical protein